MLGTFQYKLTEADLSLQLLESQQRKAASKLTVTVLSQQFSPEKQNYTYSSYITKNLLKNEPSLRSSICIFLEKKNKEKRGAFQQGRIYHAHPFPMQHHGVLHQCQCTSDASSQGILGPQLSYQSPMHQDVV